MSKIVRVAATSMATLEASAPPFNQRTPNPDDNLRLGLSISGGGWRAARRPCVSAGRVHAGRDTHGEAALPCRAALGAGRQSGRRLRGAAWHVRCGRVLHSRTGCGFERRRALRPLRQLVCTYSKVHPTEYEIDDGVRSGSEVRVFDADFGRVGIRDLLRFELAGSVAATEGRAS